MTSPDGLVVRPVRWVDDVVDADDLAAVTRLYREYELDRIGSVDSEPAGLAAAYAWPQVLRDETALVYDGDEAVASVWVKAEEPTHDVFVDLAVAPGDHERERLESAVRHGIAAGRRHAERHPESSWTLRITVWNGDAVAAEVVEAHGLTPSRRFYRMRIDADSPAIPATAPPLPPGVELVVRDDEETRRTMWAVDNESFLDHYNFALGVRPLVGGVGGRRAARPVGLVAAHRRRRPRGDLHPRRDACRAERRLCEHPRCPQALSRPRPRDPPAPARLRP